MRSSKCPETNSVMEIVIILSSMREWKVQNSRIEIQRAPALFKLPKIPAAKETRMLAGYICKMTYISSKSMVCR